MSTEQRAASLLSLIAAKALVPGGFANVATTTSRERSDADVEEQRAQTMMYAARMTYLQDKDTVKPDTLFLTRKRAQKLVNQDGVAAMSMRKLDIGGKASNSSSSAGGGDGKGMNGQLSNASPNWKKQPQRGLLPLDDRQQTWEPVTQAGCHFWQSQETGECRADAPGAWEGHMHPDLVRQGDDDDAGDEDDPQFPQAFAFLNDPH